MDIMKYADLDVLQYVIHVKEHHVHEERSDGASPARRTRERRWRAGSAVVAGLLALALGSSGCATALAANDASPLYAALMVCVPWARVPIDRAA